MRLAGKVALITGGTKGVGAATARLMAKEGARVVVTARSEGPGREMEAELCRSGADALFVPHDVSDQASWQNVINAVEKRFGALDILVNNAGVYVSKPFEETTLSDLDLILNINLRGVFLGMQLALPLMKKTADEGQAGAIINVSSTAAMAAPLHDSIYSASKGAVQLLTRSIAKEFARGGYNIRVNTVNPGIIETDMTERAMEKMVATGVFENREAAVKALLEPYPMGRFAMPEEVASMILFLASDESRYLTGGAFLVDGGETA